MAVTNLGTGGAALDAQSGSTSGADTNDPLHLAHDGTNYVYLPGVAGNYLSVPDANDLDITGDIDIRVRVALDDWADVISPYLIAKNESGQWSWAIQHSSAKTLNLYWTEDGSTLKVASSTASHTTANGEAVWLRVTLDVDNGAGGRDVKFYTSSDGSSWTQLGSTVTQAGTTSVYSGTSLVGFGANSTGGQQSTGKVYRAQVYDGIDGTKVLDVDTSVITSGSATSFQSVDSSPKTVTVNRATSGRKAVAVTAPVWLLGTDDFFEVADNALLDFGASESFTVLAVVRQWATQGFSVIAGKSDGVGSSPSYVIWTNSGNVVHLVGDSSTNTQASKAEALGAASVIIGTRNVDSDTVSIGVNGGAPSVSTDATTGTQSNALPFRVGDSSTGGAPGNFELLAAAVWRRALTDAEIALVTSYYQSRWP